MGTLTTPEVADLLGVSEGAVRVLVARDKLRPLRPGAKPLRFRERDVIDLDHARRTRAERERLDTLARGWLAQG